MCCTLPAAQVCRIDHPVRIARLSVRLLLADVVGARLPILSSVGESLGDLERLLGLAARPVAADRLGPVTRDYDEMLEYTTAVRLGTASSKAILRL